MSVGNGRGHNDGERGCDGAAASNEQQQPGPKQIELLLNTQRPDVPQPRAVGLGNIIENKRRGSDDIGGGEPDQMQMMQQQNRGKENVERRPDSEGSPEIEIAQIDSLCFFQFAQQQPGDEKSADDEENADAQSAVENVAPGAVVILVGFQASGAVHRVEADDQRDGDGTQAVERGDSAAFVDGDIGAGR
jgi:hypothetical protein